MAEAILKKLVANRPDAEEWHIESAGIWAHEGLPAALLSQLMMREMGLDISLHQAKRVSRALLHHFNLILTMEHLHKEGLINQYKPFEERIYLLSEMVGKFEDVPDPIGSEYEYYQATAKTLQLYLSEGLEKIYQLAKSPETTIST
jgi:protein-tyrosine-phosphatase